MSPEIKLKWVDVSWNQMSRHSKRGRYLWVSDGAHSHATVLPSSVSILDALANYADGHVTVGEQQEVTYQMWQYGQIMVSGKHTFEAKH
jgi:hypothetical protein